MRSPLSSRTNSRAVRVIASVGFAGVAWCMVMVSPFLSQLRFDPASHVPGSGISRLNICVDLNSPGARLFGRNGGRCPGEIGRTLLEERRERFLGVLGMHSLAEFQHFGFDGRSDLV